MNAGYRRISLTGATRKSSTTLGPENVEYQALSLRLRVEFRQAASGRAHQRGVCAQAQHNLHTPFPFAGRAR
jgi:hypothetical protein